MSNSGDLTGHLGTIYIFGDILEGTIFANIPCYRSDCAVEKSNLKQNKVMQMRINFLNKLFFPIFIVICSSSNTNYSNKFRTSESLKVYYQNFNYLQWKYSLIYLSLTEFPQFVEIRCASILMRFMFFYWFRTIQEWADKRSDLIRCRKPSQGSLCEMSVSIRA